MDTNTLTTDLAVIKHPTSGRHTVANISQRYPAQTIAVPSNLCIQVPEYPGLNITIGPNTETGLPIVIISTDDVPEDSPMIGPDGEPYIEVVLGRDSIIYDREPQRFAVTQSITYYIDADTEEKAMGKLSEISETLPRGVQNVNMEAHADTTGIRLVSFPELADPIDSENPGEVVA